MDGAEVAAIAGLIADPARARILRALIDGTRRPAGELACVAGISAQSASAHLAKLVNGGLLALESQGRHRYFRLANASVADAIEGLDALTARIRSVPPTRVLPKEMPIGFLHARSCYDHLAGETAVRICDAMLKARWIAPDGRDFRMTAGGERKLAALGVDVGEARRQHRVFARACVDLTQRRPHVGGALGAALLRLYVDRGWVLRTRSSRVVTITPKGEEALATRFR